MFYPVLVTPNFKYYLEFDGVSSFRILDLNETSPSVMVPKHIIDLPDHRASSAKEVVRRFKWVDENRFLYIDQHGFERLIDWTQDFKEEGFA